MFRVLVVDDEIYAVKGIIDGIDWGRLDVSETYEAYHAREAKAILENISIDLMICDINMPEENGLELLEWARTCRPDMETIFLTCHADFNYARKALQLGSCDYLLKPVLYEDMEEVLRKNLDRILSKKSSRKDMESYRNYYGLLEEWKKLLESGDRETADGLIEQTAAWIRGRNESREDLVKVYQGIYQIAVYVIKKKGLSFHDINLLEWNPDGKDTFQATGEFKQKLERIIAVVCSDSVADDGRLRENSIVMELKRFIGQNLSRRMSREELSEHVHLNESYLSRLFHKETGMSLSDYILQERMKKAGELIAESDEPISEIANRLCYDNFSYFSKMFRKVYQMTPQEYRKKNSAYSNSQKQPADPKRS